jgi:hypothetical protein
MIAETRNVLFKAREPKSDTYVNVTPVVSGAIRCGSKIGHYLNMCSKEINWTTCSKHDP